VEEALEESRPLAAGDPVLAKSLARQAQLVAAWRGVVAATVRRGSSTEAEHEKVDPLLSALRDTNVGCVARIGERRSRALTVSGFANGAIVLGFSVFGLAGAFLLARRNRRSESAYAAAEGAVRAAQEELAEALQVASGEDETYSLLRRHSPRRTSVGEPRPGRYSQPTPSPFPSSRKTSGPTTSTGPATYSGPLPLPPAQS
jgi:hypothetical protein